MSKNYFTDEQVNAIHKEICRLEDLDRGISMPFQPLNHIEIANLHRIINLAVETAIGEPVAYCRSDTALDWKGQSINIATMFPSPKGLSNPIPLYSVKELEN